MRKYFVFVLTVFIFVNFIFAQNVNDQNSRTHYKLGLSYYERNDYKNAISEFKEAIKFDPSNANAYYSLGTVFLSIGNYVEAIKNLELSTQYNPNIGDAFYNLGISYYRTRSYNKSVNAFKSAIALNQNDLDYHINLGVVYRIMGKYPEAIIEYQKALLLKSTSIPALLNLGVAYRLNGDIDKAIEHYNKVLRIDGNNKEALYNLSLIKRSYDMKNVTSGKPVSFESKSKTYTKSKRLSDISGMKGEYTSSQTTGEPVYFSTQESYVNLKDEIGFTRKIVEEIKTEMKKMSTDYNKFKANLLKRFDALDNSAKSEIKQVTEKAGKELDSQQEQYLLALDEFRKEIETIKKSKKFNKIEMKNIELNMELTSMNKKLIQMESSNRALKSQIAEINRLQSENAKLKNELQTLQPSSLSYQSPFPDYSYSTGSPYTPTVSTPSVSDILNSLLASPEQTDILSTPTGTPAPSLGKVDINTLNLQELVTLPGIDEAKAKNIIWYRENMESFKSFDDIIKVPGISLEDYNRLKKSIKSY